MAGWTESGGLEGRRYAARILAELIEVRSGGEPVGARLLIEDASSQEPLGTIAQATAMAESLLHRLAEAYGESEVDVLAHLLKETATAGQQNVAPLAPPARASRRRSRTA